MATVSSGEQSIVINSIVEGRYDGKSIQNLLKRYFPSSNIIVTKPIHTNSRDEITKKGGIERFLDLAATKTIYQKQVILVLIDADKNPCPGKLAIELTRRAAVRNLPYPIAVVVAKHMYEAWLIARIETIAKQQIGGMNAASMCKQDPDEISDPKGWLSRHMTEKKDGYDPKRYQLKMTEYLDFNLVKTRSHSFQHLLKKLNNIVNVPANQLRGYVIPRP